MGRLNRQLYRPDQKKIHIKMLGSRHFFGKKIPVCRKSASEPFFPDSIFTETVFWMNPTNTHPPKRRHKQHRDEHRSSAGRCIGMAVHWGSGRISYTAGFHETAVNDLHSALDPGGLDCPKTWRMQFKISRINLSPINPRKNLQLHNRKTAASPAEGGCTKSIFFVFSMKLRGA